MQPSENVHVLEARASDLDELTRLFGAYLVFYQCAADEAGVRSYLAARLSEGPTRFFIASADGIPAGFMHLLPSWDTLGMKPAWILQDLFVDPEFRKRGVASALLVRAEALARTTGCSRVTLSTARSNITAQRVYEAHGYERDDVFLTYDRTLT